MTGELLTKRQAAQRLAASTRMIDRLAESGKLERISLSSRASRITAASLDAYMASRPSNQGSGPTPTAFDGFSVPIAGMSASQAERLRETIDVLLGDTFPAISVWQRDREICVAWPMRCNYGDRPLHLLERLHQQGKQHLAIATRKAAKKPS